MNSQTMANNMKNAAIANDSIQQEVTLNTLETQQRPLEQQIPSHQSITVDSMGNMVFSGSTINKSQESSLSSPPSDSRIPPEDLHGSRKMALHYEEELNKAPSGLPPSLVSQTKHSAFGIVHHGTYATTMASSNSKSLQQQPRDPGGHKLRAMATSAVERLKSASPDDSGSGDSRGEKMESLSSSDAYGGQPMPMSATADKQEQSDGSGSSRNVVTAGTSATTNTTTTTSSDPDSSGGGNGTSSAMSSMPRDESSSGDLVRLHHHSHHHHRSRRGRVLENDGSTLQVPVGDDGFHPRLLGGPATVVASRLPPPNSDTTTNASSSGSGGEAEPSQETLLQPHREPGYHTIRKTFSRLPKHGAPRLGGQRSSATDSSSTVDETNPTRSSSQEPKTKRLKLSSKKSSPRRPRDTTAAAIRFRDPDPVDGRESPSPDSVGSSSNGGGEGSSSGSGTEGGYAGSASSNEMHSGQQESSSSSSPSVSSSEDSRPKPKSKRHHRSHHHHKESSRKISKRSESKDENYSSSSSSSEIADFSSGASILNDEENAVGLSINTFDPAAAPSTSPSLSSANEESLDGLEETYLNAKNDVAVQEDPQVRVLSKDKKRKAASWSHKTSSKWTRPKMSFKASKSSKQPPILRLGSDVMAHVLTFLHPPDILDVLTMPLSKEWRQTFTLQPELWRVLCLVEPFKARMEEDDDDDTNTDDSDTSSSEDSIVSIKMQKKMKKKTKQQKGFDKGLLGRYRLLYSSFVRCMKYLSQIREDALNGREPAFIDYGGIAERGRSSKRGPPLLLGSNRNLQLFLARARGVVEEAKSNASSENDEANTTGAAKVSAGYTSEKRRAEKSYAEGKPKKKRPKFGNSMITGRLLGPSQAGDPGDLTLPWSCAIYSIVNWMVGFLDVEGIQILCLKVLPFLLEDETQRMTAQRTGLTDVILRAMVLFDKSVQLQIAAFHTIVLLARPLGGKEGMLFHSSMVASGIFGGQTSQHRKNGIGIMVESMRRFEDNEILQAMSCWALVNIALAPAQKAVLVKLGGIQATLNAMLRHPFNAEVQFRALFALINLVIPSISLNNTNSETLAVQDQRGGETNSQTTEKEIIDELVGEISDLVVRAMTNFCSSEAILNRACLVLHNLSLTPGYHETLLWTPNCYQMLEWCLANYRTDQVLQQSASGTLNRLQATLSNDDNLRTRFADSLNAQHRRSLQQAHNEAVRIHEQEQQQNGQGPMNQIE